MVIEDLLRDTNGALSVGDTPREGVNCFGLMRSGQTSFIVASTWKDKYKRRGKRPTVGIVVGDVLVVHLRQFLNGVLDILETTGFSHFQSRKVGMTASPVPIPFYRLRIQRADNPKVFTHPTTGGGCRLPPSTDLCKMYRAIHSWSPIAIPSHGPT